LTSCISKKEITTQVVDCIPSDSCTFHFTITETHEKLDIIDPVPFFTIILLPRQGIGGHTDFDGEYKLTLKRSTNTDTISFLGGQISISDTFNIELEKCKDDYYFFYDLPQWFKDSLNALPAPKIIKRLPCRF
jgi:hypothetical protein